ncbi:MAG TPA: PDZ domain-containing protein, partial [Candidatus Angelobacter sp.]
MPGRVTGKYPLGRYVALAALLAATTAYHLRTIQFRFPEWLGKSTVIRPFFIPEVELASNGAERNVLSFVTREARELGLQNGDTLLKVNGAPVSGMAVYGEALRKARPGDKILVEVLRHEGDGTSAEKIFAVPVWPPRHSWPGDMVAGLLVSILPFFSVLLGFWVVFIRPYDVRAWLLLALMLGYEAFFDPGVESWGPWARDFGVAFWVGAKATFSLWLLLFAVYFPEPFPSGTKRASTWKWLQWLFVIPLGLLALADVAMYIGDLENYGSVEFLRRLPHAVTIIGVCLTYAAIGQAVGCFATKYMTAVSPDSKRRLRLLFFASLVTIVPFVLLRWVAILGNFNLEIDFPGWLWWSTYFLFFLFPVALAYIILVERAMDVRLVLRQGLQYGLAKNGIMAIRIMATATVLLAGVALISNSARNRVEKITVIVVGVVAVFTIRRGAEKLKSWTDRRFFREAYNAEHVLSELSDHVRTIVEPQPLLATVVGRISETLHVPQIAVMLNSGSPYQPAYSLGYEGILGLAFSSESATVKVLEAKKEPVRV